MTEPPGPLYAALRADLNPVGWKAPTAFVKRAGGRYFAGMSPAVEVVAYQEALREVLLPSWEALGVDTITTECRLDLRFSRQLVTYESQSGRKVTKHRQDLTNLRKSTEDALQPWLVKNDVLVTQGWTEIVEQSKTASPYVEIIAYLL